MCQRERKREREREFNNENNKCKSESEFIEKSYIRARACPRKHTLPVVIHAICVSDFLPFRGQIFFPRVTVNTDHSSLPRASFFHAHFKIKREKSKRERDRAPEFSLVMGCCFSTEQRHRDGDDTQEQRQQRHSQRRNSSSSSSRQRNARREMDGRFRQHQHRGHRTTMSSEYVFGVKNPFAKFVGKEEDGEEDYPPGGDGGGDDGETREEEELSMERASSANTIGGDDEIETGSDGTVSNGEQVRLLKKERKLSDDREGKKAESLSAAFMRRSFGVGASGSANHNNNNNNNKKKKNKHRRTESEPPMNVIGRGNNNSFNSSGKEQPSGGRTSRIARLASTTADDSYKAFEDDGEDEQQAQIEEQKNNIVRRSATIATSTSTAKARHFRSLSVSAAKFERDGSNNSKEPNDLRASIFEALEKSNNNNNREDVQPQEDRPATPFDDNNCCPTCFEEYQEDNPKITLACAHHFHLACIVEWNERGHSECPTCMTDVGFYMDDDA